MFKKLAVVLLAAASLTAGLTPAMAHHSSAMFDKTKEVVLKGTVKEFQWTAPHVWVQIDVPDAEGKVVTWGVEATNPLALSRQGWKRTSFKPGDKVSFTVNPGKDGKPIASFIGATLADGSTLGRQAH
jgi:hypothetical protein